MTDTLTRERPLHLPSLASELPKGWTWMRLDDACENVWDCPHSTPKVADAGPLMARSQDVRSGVFLIDQAARVSEQTYEERVRRAEPEFGDLLYSREGTYFGIAAEVPRNTRVCLGQRMVLIRPNAATVDFRFLRYWLNSPILSAFIHGHRDGTVAERLNLPTIRALPVPVAPLKLQHRIGEILNDFDDKIELNRRMNQTLEAIVRRLFRSWFVDFDPVRAKAALRREHPKWDNPRVSRQALPNLDPAIAELFPDELVDSELGEVPKGWRVGTVGDVADNPKRTTKPHEIERNTPYIALEHIPRRQIGLDDWGNADEVASNKYRFNRGDVLFGKLRPYFHKVGLAPVDGVCSTDVLVIVPTEPSWRGFALGHISSDEMISHSDGASTGTKMPRTNWKDISQFAIAIPIKELAQAFDDQIDAALQRLRDNVHEARSLADTRDKLLPRLLSGELSEKAGEKVAQ